MPGRGGGGGIGTPAAGRQPGGGSAPPPPGPIRDPNTGVITFDPLAPAPQPPKKQRRRKREIIRRQRLLRNAGYKIAIDGNWGPRSQRAWNKYLKTRSVVIRDLPQDRINLADPDKAPSVTLDKREQAYQARVEKRRRAEAAAKKQIEDRRKAILSRAATLRRDPTAARDMTIPQIAEVLTDKEVDYHPDQNVNLTKALQYKLLAKGYKVKVTGRFDGATVKALKQAEAKSIADERRKQAQFVIDRLYAPGFVKPGDKPPWASVAIPTPGELVKLVQGNSFMGALIFGELMQRALSPEVGWQLVQAENLARIANKVAPYSASAMMYRLTGKDASAVPLWQYMVDIAGVQDFVPFVDYSLKAGFTEEERRKALSARAHDKDVITENAMRRKGTVGQAAALLGATGPKDFQNRMAQLAVEQEAKFKQIQLAMASQEAPWWGDVLNAIFWSGEQVRSRGVQVWAQGQEALRGGATGGAHGVHTVSQADAERFIRESNPVVRFAMEMTFDPLNLVAPVRWASTGAALGLRTFGKGASVGRYVLVGDKLGRALKYQKGTWSKIDVGKFLAASDDPFHIADSRFAAKMEEVTRRLAVTKDEAMSAVSMRLKSAHRLGWKMPAFKVAGVDVSVPKFGSKEAQEWIEKTDLEMAQMLRDAPMFQRVLNVLKERRASLYAGHLRGPKSQVGAALSGHMAETFRPLLVANIALKTANETYRARLAAEAGAGLNEEEMRAAVLVARTEAEKEYTTILRGFGTWRAGGADAALKDWGGKNLQEELGKRVAQLQEQLELILFPAIQDELERHADTVLRAAKSKHELTADTVRAAAKPVTHGGEQDFLRYEDLGEPGFHFVQVKNGKAAVFRAEDGSVQGHALVGDNGSVRVFVAPKFRRQGVATQLYQTLSLHGVPIEELSAKGPITAEGAEFFAGRRAKMAGATEHPLWDEGGNWRGAQAEMDGDLVRTIRSSFDEPIQVRNYRFGVGHTDAQMVEIVTRELSIALGRLDDYAARRIATGVLDEKQLAVGAAAHSAEEERLIGDITGAWSKGDDGKWYDSRQTLPESKLYARHLGAYDKPLAFNDETGEIDMLAMLGQAHAPSDLTPFERDLFNIGASMADVWSSELAGSGFRTPGLEGVFTQHGEKLRAALDRRAYALRLAEEAALPSLLMEQSAVWRAFQYSQGRKTQLAYKGLTAQLALWKFATLALRPAWAVRNFIDNVAKGFIAGVRDPRYYIAGPGSAVGKKLGAVLEQDIAQLRQLISFLDDLFGTNVGHHFDTIINTIWEHSSETLSRMFKMLDVEVPPEVFEQGLRNDVWDRSRFKLIDVADNPRLEKIGADPRKVRPPGKKPGEENFAERVRNGAWNLMGGAPENYMRRVIYRHEYTKALRELSDDATLNSVQVHLEATSRALKKVEDTLFDYSKISVAEDNLKVFFPFIQFWRKNSVFWMETMATQPWVPLAVLHFDDDRRNAHGDQPMWMQRYFHTDEIADALAVVPGLDEAFEYLGLGDGAMFDPISMTSLAPFYRAFKQGVYGENQFLPADRAARIKVVGAIIDSLNDWGLGMNPFLRKPLEGAGIANYRAWQRVFPQTAMVEALANASGQEGIARLVVSMEQIASLNLGAVGSNEIADNFDYWVQTVVAEQVARGEEPDIAKAEQTVRDWFLIQNLWGYFGGIYWRRATPEDMYLAKLQDDILTGEQDFENLTDEQKKQLKFWGMRGMDRLTYDRYVGLQPVIEAYYRGDNETKNKIKRDNPEIIRWVDGSFTGHPVSQKFVRYAQRYVDQELYFEAMEIADTLDVSPEIRQMVVDMYLSPELKAYWEKNATPTRIRNRMIQAEVRDYFNTLNKGYFAIPEDDFEARDQYLNDHPELARQWSKDNDVAESYGAIYGGAKADLRDVYFKIVEREGWEGAADFLKTFPFMFEGTDSEKKIQDGEWIPGGGKWSAERVADFREAKPHLKWFFEGFLPKVGAKQAFAWLDKTDAEAGLIVKAYLKKYPSSKRLAWLKASPWLKVYFGLPPEKRGEWLRGDTEGARIVRDFFAKYGDKMSQHAKDWLSHRKDLDYYGSLPKEERNAWLQSDDPRAKRVLEYFKKYGKQHQFERAFKKLVAKYPELAHGTPEQVRRMKFWREYFSLPPDSRPMFVLNHAEDAGVFVYGEFGEQHNHDQEQEYLRRAVGLGLSKRQSAYLYVKPLLDFYRTLPKDEKPLFVQANPELGWYFDNFSKASATGDKKLDKLVERYFSLPADSFARSQFLRKHPDVQDWFDKKSTPAEAAMRNLLEQYFSLDGWERQDFLLDHPEIQTYFDQRRAERDAEQAQREAFDDADPRLAPFYEDSADLIRAAERMRAKLRQSALDRLVPNTIETRRERRSAAA